MQLPMWCVYPDFFLMQIIQQIAKCGFGTVTINQGIQILHGGLNG